MAGQRELELKLLVPAGEQDRLLDLLTARPDIQGEPRRGRQVTTYFDTADMALARRGVALRVRRSGTARVQAVKTFADPAGSPAAGIAARGEWEWPVSGDIPDLSLLAGTGAATLVPSALAPRLVPLFVTDIQRTVVTLAPTPLTLVEVALDQGRIAAPASPGAPQRPVSEVELELKAGVPGDLFRLALELHLALPLQLCIRSKADAGFALCSLPRVNADLRRSAAPTPATTVAEGLRLGGRLGLAALLEAAPDVAGGGDGAALARLAEAGGSLAATLALFKREIADPALRETRDGLDRLLRPIETASAWDGAMALLEGQADVPRSLLLAAAGARRAARQQVLGLLAGPDWTTWLLGFGAWLEDDRALAGAAETTPLAQLAPELLRRRLSKLRRAVRGLTASQPDPVWERVERRTRRLAQLLELCGPVLPPEMHEPVADVLARLAPAVREESLARSTLRLVGQLPTSAAEAPGGLRPALRAIAERRERACDACRRATEGLRRLEIAGDGGKADAKGAGTGGDG